MIGNSSKYQDKGQISWKCRGHKNTLGKTGLTSCRPPAVIPLRVFKKRDAERERERDRETEKNIVPQTVKNNDRDRAGLGGAVFFYCFLSYVFFSKDF